MKGNCNICFEKYYNDRKIEFDFLKVYLGNLKK